MHQFCELITNYLFITTSIMHPALIFIRLSPFISKAYHIQFVCYYIFRWSLNSLCHFKHVEVLRPLHVKTSSKACSMTNSCQNHIWDSIVAPNTAWPNWPLLRGCAISWMQEVERGESFPFEAGAGDFPPCDLIHFAVPRPIGSLEGSLRGGNPSEKCLFMLH